MTKKDKIKLEFIELQQSIIENSKKIQEIMSIIDNLKNIPKVMKYIELESKRAKLNAKL